MPFKSETMPLPQEYDRRRKLSEEQKDEIRHKYSTGMYSLKMLAEEYHVSIQLIHITVNPEAKRKNDERTKEHWRDYVPSKSERAAIMREHRKYKRDLYLSGKLR